MGKEKRGPLALELWAKQLIENDCYPGVTVRNMTTSWRNGLAFCALIHRFRPDLIDYDKLDPMDIIGNNSLAFEVAESKLGIPSLLDPLDMDAMECPDRLSVLTYVAQFYSAFKNLEAKSRVSPPRDRDENDALENRPSEKSTGSPSPDKKIVTKRRKNEVDEDEIMDKVRRSMPKRAVLFNSSNVCFECKNPVFISERVLFMKKLYHRSCFCCSKCKNPLNPHIVDVSSDGSLYCLEKTCHAELLRMTTTGIVNESSTMNNFVPDDGRNIVRRNNEKSEMHNTNANPISDSSADSNQQSLKLKNLPTEAAAVSLVSSSMRPRFDDNVHGDSHSQGDMQEFVEKEKEVIASSPTNNPNTPPSTRKLLDFAGALLLQNNNDEKPAEPQNLQQVEGSTSPPSTITVADLIGKDQPSSDIVPVQEESVLNIGKEVEDSERVVIEDEQEVNEEQVTATDSKNTDKDDNEKCQTANDESKSDLLLVKSAPEITSIRENAILTIADQFRASVEEAETNNKKEKEEKQIQQSLEPSIVVEKESLKNDSVEAKVEQSELSHTPETIEEQQQTNLVENDDDEEEEGKDKTLTRAADSAIIITSTPNASPSPVPKMRPPKPPPPKFSNSNSPTSPFPPAPIPRSRTNQIPTSSSAAGTEDDSKPTNELWKKKGYYPSELNPFASEEDLPQAVKEESKNPFEDDDDDDVGKEQLPPPTPSPRPRPRSEINNNGKSTTNTASTNKEESPSLPRKNAANFNVPPPRPPPPQTSPRKLPQQGNPVKPYNPFEDDDDDIGEYDHHEEDDKPSPGAFSKPPPDDTSSISSKTSDLSSSISGIPTPTPRSLNASDTEGSGSLKTRSRKSRRAPLPPNMMLEQSQSIKPESRHHHQETPQTRKVIPVSPKLMKGLGIANNNSPNHHQGGVTTTPRKKRRAPPPRRRVEPLPEAAIKTEFADLEIKLKELERQGIALETKIRSLPDETDPNENEQGGPEEDDLEVGATASNSGGEGNELADELMIQLWGIVNEKNDILRRQTELEYLRRGHRLEEMQSDLEFKLRILMDTPEDQKEPNHADMEQILLQQLLKLVDERNEVVDWLDYHRQKDREEELMLSQSITEFSNSNAVEPIPDQPSSSSKSKSKDKKHKDKSKMDEKEKKKDGKLRLGIFKKKSKKPKPVEGSTPPS